MRILCLRSAEARIVPMRPGAGEPAWGQIIAGNPLGPAGLSLPDARAALRIIAWSGTLADSEFGNDPRTWGPRGWEALDALCDRLSPELARRGVTLCFRPHARHVLSDAPSCAKFLSARTERSGGRRLFELLLDPVSMLTGSMLAGAEDHLARIYGSLASVDGTAAVLVANVGEAAGASTDGEAAAPAPLHRGVVPTAMLLSLVRRTVPARVPLVISDQWGDVAGQLAALAGLASDA